MEIMKDLRKLIFPNFLDITCQGMELREIRLVHIFPGYYMSGDGAKRDKVS